MQWTHTVQCCCIYCPVHDLYLFIEYTQSALYRKELLNNIDLGLREDQGGAKF